MSKYKATTHVAYNIGYHVVFCPKYRYNLLRYKAANILKRLLKVKASNLPPANTVYISSEISITVDPFLLHRDRWPYIGKDRSALY